MSMRNVLPKLLVLLTVAVALLGGLGSGLARMGWQMDTLSQSWLMIHGPLMISGFLGTLICLERAVALASRYPTGMSVPVINAVGALVLLVWPESDVARVLLTAGSLGLVALFGLMLRLHHSNDVVIMATGAVCWLLGNLLWLSGYAVYAVVHLWTAFLILTIVGERLELSRVRRLTGGSEHLLLFAVGIYLIGVLWTVVHLDSGIRFAGMGALGMMAWLLHYDIARRTIQRTGLPRYIAVCLLTGYLWLGFGGLMSVWIGAVYAGFDYAVILHAFLLGFVFSMIFGHMPIILPALTGLRVSYTPVFYLPLIWLHLTLVYRIAGNLTQDVFVRQWGGLLNALAILLFMLITAVTTWRMNRSHSDQRAVSVTQDVQNRVESTLSESLIIQ